MVWLLGLTLLLGLIALLGLKPWADDSVEPRLTSPLDAAVGDAVALPSGPVALVADATVVRSEAGLAQMAGRADGTEGRKALLAVAPARAVTVATAPVGVPAEPETEAGADDEAPSVGATAVETPPEGTSSPASTPPSGSENPGPTTAVLESCEGDEYVITVVLVPGAEEGEEAEEPSVEIVLQRFNEDGSVNELTLEGDVLDARNLALQLDSEGNCVYLQADAGEEEDAPSDGTSQAVVPAEGASASIPASP